MELSADAPPPMPQPMREKTNLEGELSKVDEKMKREERRRRGGGLLYWEGEEGFERGGEEGKGEL